MEERLRQRAALTLEAEYLIACEHGGRDGFVKVIETASTADEELALLPREVISKGRRLRAERANPEIAALRRRANSYRFLIGSARAQSGIERDRARQA
jgi:hypothetical protein